MIQYLPVQVAFTRWVKGRPNAYINADSLLQHPVMHRLMTENPAVDSTQPPSVSPQAPDIQAMLNSGLVSAAQAELLSSLGRPPRVALVFGREELGISDAEVDTCDVACSILIGRLQVRAEQPERAVAGQLHGYMQPARLMVEARHAGLMPVLGIKYLAGAGEIRVRSCGTVSAC